jgi:amino acid transporter
MNQTPSITSRWMSDLGWGVLPTLGVLALLVFLVTCAIVLILVVKIIKKYKLVHQPDMPVSVKVSYYGSIIYTVFPIDLLPDPVLLDDILVLVAALMYIGHIAKKIYGDRSTGGTDLARR